MISQPPELAGSRLEQPQLGCYKDEQQQDDRSTTNFLSHTVQEVGSQKCSFFIPSTIHHTWMD